MAAARKPGQGQPKHKLIQFGRMQMEFARDVTFRDAFFTQGREHLLQYLRGFPYPLVGFLLSVPTGGQLNVERLVVPVAQDADGVQAIGQSCNGNTPMLFELDQVIDRGHARGVGSHAGFGHQQRGGKTVGFSLRLTSLR